MLKPDTTNSPCSVSVIIPMFGEENRVGRTLADAIPLLAEAAYPTELVLIDDGSADRTVEVVTPYLTDVPRGSLEAVRLVQHDQNRGKGAAVRTGFAHSTGDWRLIMDADNAATVWELEKLLARVGPGVGLIAGSRVAPDSDVRAVPLRRFTGWCFKTALRLMGLNLLRDTQCGFKLYRSDLADLIAEHGIEDGYAFDLEHLLITRAAGLEAVEAGIAWTHMDGGQVSPLRDGLRMLGRAWRLRRRRGAIEDAVGELPREIRPVAAGAAEVVTLPAARAAVSDQARAQQS